MWAVLLSALTIGYSLITKKDTEENRTPTPTSLRLFGIGDSLSKENRLFVAGVVLGLGCSLLYKALTDQFRIHARVRYFWYCLWNDEQANPTDALWSESAPIREARDYLVKTEDGSIRMIVTPQKAATSSLNITLLTLHPGREIPSTRSIGVEFYYVLSGSGSFSQQGVHGRRNVSAGDCFLVQPRQMRWISNTKGTDDFVLLRASDDGSEQYCSRMTSSTMDRIRMDPTSHPMNRLRDGIRKVQSMAKDFVRTSSSEWYKPSS